MAVELIAERALSPIGETVPVAVLTPRGRAVARLIAFEDAWAELDGPDRAYFASELEPLAREARVER